MLEKLANAYRDAVDESLAARLALNVLRAAMDAASLRLSEAAEECERARNALTEYICTQPAPVPPGSAE